jgi:hypothetical protein
MKNYHVIQVNKLFANIHFHLMLWKKKEFHTQRSQ